MSVFETSSVFVPGHLLNDFYLVIVMVAVIVAIVTPVVVALVILWRGCCLGLRLGPLGLGFALLLRLGLANLLGVVVPGRSSARLLFSPSWM